MGKIEPVKRGAPMRFNPVTRKPAQSRKDDKADAGYLYMAGVKDPSKRVTEYSTEGDVCPRCSTDRQFNKSLRLLISPCYHKLCEACIDRLYSLGPEPCYACGRILRKVNFAHQTFEDLKVEKEVAVRRRMAEVYNKTEADFGSATEYDNFLEEVEDTTFNLLNDIDLEATEARIADFTKQNSAAIASNKQRAVLETARQVEREQMEKQAREERRKMVEENEQFELAEAARVKKEVVQALSRGAKKTAKDIEDRAAEAKAAREAALEGAIPPSLARFLTKTTTEVKEEDNTAHTPGSPSYDGPYVAYAYSDPEKQPWVQWVDPLDDYVDGRQGAIDCKKNKNGAFRGGFFDINLAWSMEIRAAVEGLGIEPIAG